MLTRLLIAVVCALVLPHWAPASWAQPAESRLSLQQQCSIQGGEAFLQLGGNPDKGDVYLTHFSKELDKCLMSMDFKRGNFIFGNMIDAWRLKPIAMYFRIADDASLTKDLAPKLCALMAPRRKKLTCHSSAEYRAFVGYYMEQ